MRARVSPCRLAGALAALALGAAATHAEPFRDGKLSFRVAVNGERSAYETLGLFVMPSERVAIEVVDPRPERVYALTTKAGAAEKTRNRTFAWTAPEVPGLYPLVLAPQGGEERMTLNAFVMVPRSSVKDGSLNGYRIGEYPTIPLKGLSIYKAPRGFVEVTAANRNALVSPHFRLGQFLCKQAGGYPKYVVLRERLLLKLELLLQEANAAGFRADTFHVMSGYRTPFYNKAIGNVKYSRHVYGGAADIFIDANPVDGVMDDLNKDGKFDVRDAAVLYEVVDRLFGQERYAPFVGGLGQYKKTAAHGPFVHVDVRGFRARWGR